MKIICYLLLSLLFSGCTQGVALDSFQAQSCRVVYCESSENSKVKAAGLKLIAIALATQGVDLTLGRGFCEEYYMKREIDYRYALKPAAEVCQGE